MSDPTATASIDIDSAQRALIEAVFDAASTAVARLASVATTVDKDRVEYAVASLLLEEVWVDSSVGGTPGTHRAAEGLSMAGSA